MSGHSFGAGSDPARQQKVDTLRLAEFHQTDLKLQANLKAPMTTVRPIAPTPNVTQIRQPLQVSATQLLGGGAGQTSISSKIASAIGFGGAGSQLAAGDHSAQLTAVNLANLNPGVSQSPGGTQIRTINAQQPLLQLHSQQQTGAALNQQNVVRLQNSVQVATMSSIIKGVPVSTLVQGQQAQAHPQVGSHQMQVFPAAHLPRGAAAASQLTATKASGVATAMLRSTQPGATALQIPASVTAGGGATMVPTGVPQHLLQPRAILPVRGQTPPNTRAESPVVQMHHGHGDGHKPIVSHQTSIQISVQQRNPHRVSQIQQSKTVSVTQSMMQPQSHQPGQIGSSQKLVMSTSNMTPVLQSAGAIHTPLSLPGGPKIGVGQLMTPTMRQSKIISTQPSNMTGHNATAYALSNTRPSKIIVTQAGAPQNLPTGTIITTVAKTSALAQTLPRQQQQKVMSQSVNTMATTMTVPSLPTKGVAHISLHSGSSQINTSTTTTLPIGALRYIPEFPAKITPQRQTSLGAPHNLAHLQQQQQSHHSITHTHQQAAAQLDQLRVSATTQSSHHQSLVQQAAIAGGGGQLAGTGVNAASVYLAQKPGATTNMMSPGPALSQGTVHSGEAAANTSHHQLQYNNMANLTQYYNTANIGNTMGALYQQAHAMAANRTNLHKIQSQTPSLTATLQGTGHGGASITVSGATQPHPVGVGGNAAGPTPVRITNPSVMVTVDPSTRHATTTIQQNAQQISSAELLTNKSVQVTQNFKYVNKADSNLVATMASSHLNAAMGASHQSANQNTVPSSSNLTSSPRPSILRKRNNDGITVVKRQILGGPSLPPPPAMSDGSTDYTHLPQPPMGHHQHHQVASQLHHIPHLHTAPSLPSNTLQHHHPTAAMSPKSTVLDVCNENSQSSTDTASSTQSTPQSKHYPHSMKPEHLETLENGHLSGSLQNNNEASPRKKPRKQLLTHVNSEEPGDGAGDIEEHIQQFSQKVYSFRQAEREETEPEDQPEIEEVEEYVDDEGVRWVREKKRPPIALLNHYQCSWKPKNNHFLRHTDVKPKEERRPTVNELANQKNVLQKSSGWKMYHLAAQVEELMDIEKVVYDKMVLVQDQVAPKHIAKTTMEDDIGMVHELSQGNIQRCQLFTDQMQEAKTAMLKILDHKKRILEIITKHHSKRPVKKKERS